MLKKILIAIVALLCAFLAFVATREGKFHYERSGVIQASPEKIFPYLISFQKGQEWSPYTKADPQMKISYSGTEGALGSVMQFESNQAGSGHLELVGMLANKSVDIRLVMAKPFAADNQVHYSLEPVEGGTKFTWAMDGEGGFMGKLISVVINCEKMVGDQFSEGIANLKKLVESGQPTAK